MQGACILDPTYGQFFIMIQTIPLVVGSAFTGVTYVTGNLFFACLGFYLFALGYFVWPFQYYLNVTRNPLLCPLGAAQYEFPAIEMLYVSALVTMVVYYSIFFHGRPGWLSYLMLFFTITIPAIVLTFFQFNVWYEVLLSAAIGMIGTIVFMIHMQLFIAPALPYLELVPPFSTFSYSDDLGFGYNSYKYPAFQKQRKLLHEQANYKYSRWKIVDKND